jgi:cephalosporin hydroxylase
MKLTIDTDNRTLLHNFNGKIVMVDLYSKEAFELISQIWLKVGWNEKYPYTFSWLGRPIIQLPEDMIRIQEVVYQLQPDVIVETGIAHGGSLIYYAGLCKIMGTGRVIGIDIEIRPYNRKAIEAHELFPWITLIEGSSIAAEVVECVKKMIAPGETVLVVLDSNHTKEHVSAELEAYHALVTPGSYIIATDGSMQMLTDVPRGEKGWLWNNPAEAVSEFATNHPEFVIEQPTWPFNESELTANVTHWPGAWLKRR